MDAGLRALGAMQPSSRQCHRHVHEVSGANHMAAEPKTPTSQPLAGGAPCAGAPAVAASGHWRDIDPQARIDAGRGDVSLVWHAPSPSVINPRHEMPPGWARLVGRGQWSAIPVITTMAVFITKIAGATSFGNFHDCAVFRLIYQRRVTVRYGDGRLRRNPAQKRKHDQRRS
jgi:hypothetical protein